MSGRPAETTRAPADTGRSETASVRTGWRFHERRVGSRGRLAPARRLCLGGAAGGVARILTAPFAIRYQPKWYTLGDVPGVTVSDPGQTPWELITTP